MLTVEQPLVFLDTETTHLDVAIARAWEIALICRPFDAVDDSRDETTHLMVAGFGADALADADPESLDKGRFHERYGPSSTATWVTEEQAAAVITSLTRPVDSRKVALVGSNPAYDAQVLAALLRRHDREPQWDYHTHDLVTWTYATFASSILERAEMPMRSYELSEMVNAAPPAEDVRHTALGDALWVRSWWDQLMTGVVQ